MTRLGAARRPDIARFDQAVQSGGTGPDGAVLDTTKLSGGALRDNVRRDATNPRLYAAAKQYPISLDKAARPYAIYVARDKSGRSGLTKRGGLSLVDTSPNVAAKHCYPYSGRGKTERHDQPRRRRGGDFSGRAERGPNATLRDIA